MKKPSKKTIKIIGIIVSITAVVTIVILLLFPQIMYLLSTQQFKNLSDETNIVDVYASRYYFVALRDDGTLAYAGRDFTIGFDPNEINEWQDISDVCVCFARIVGVKNDGTLISTATSDRDVFYEYRQWTNVKSVETCLYSMTAITKDNKVLTTNNYIKYNEDIDDWDGTTKINEKVSMLAGTGSNSLEALVGINEDGTVNTAYGIVTMTPEYTNPDWDNIVDAKGYSSHIIGLTTDGTVVASGSNEYGQCDVEDWDDVIQIDCSPTYTAAVKSDGTMLFAGESAYMNSDVTKWSNVKKIIAGEYHIVALLNDGTMLTTDSSLDVSGWTNIVDFDYSGYSVIALKDDGSVVCDFDVNWD
ncbi:MAG: hypothetical protein JXN65_11655 [Clostridia bacterium]|nr:hypothetical protein [Clostridia bacterium]